MAKVHDNELYFYCSDLTALSFSANGYKITKDQTYNGIQCSGSSGKWKINIKAGRKGSDDVAKWFKSEVQPGTATASEHHGDWPDKLNFAVEGCFTVGKNGETYKCSDMLVLGQGHSGSYNNWWIGSKDMGMKKEYPYVQSKYTILLKADSGRELAITFSEKGTNEFNLYISEQKNGINVSAQTKPLDGQNHRCSENFSTKMLPNEPMLWLCPDGVTFNVMEAKTAANDKTHFRNVRNRTLTPYKDAENLYIADVNAASGTTSPFTIAVCPITENGIDKLMFSAISDLHFGAAEEENIETPETNGKPLSDYGGNDKDDIKKRYDSKDRKDKLATLLQGEDGGTFVMMPGDLTTCTKNSNQLDVFKDLAKNMEEEHCVPVCEGWGNHDLYYFHFSANVGNTVKDRNKNQRASWLPDFHYGTDTNDNGEHGHYCFHFDLTGSGFSTKIPVYFFMLNLEPGKGEQHPKKENSDEEDTKNNQNNPFYSKEFLLNHLPADKKSLIFVSFHYPKESIRSDEDKKWFNDLCTEYPNMYCIVGHDHEPDYISPCVGYIGKTKQFYCAGGMGNDQLMALSISLERTGEKNVRMDYHWFTNKDEITEKYIVKKTFGKETVTGSVSGSIDVEISVLK